MNKLVIVATVALAFASALKASGHYGYSMVELAISMVDPIAETIEDDVNWGAGIADIDDVNWGADLADATPAKRSVNDLLVQLFGG